MGPIVDITQSYGLSCNVPTVSLFEWLAILHSLDCAGMFLVRFLKLTTVQDGITSSALCCCANGASEKL